MINKYVIRQDRLPTVTTAIVKAAADFLEAAIIGLYRRRRVEITKLFPRGKKYKIKTYRRYNKKLDTSVAKRKYNLIRPLLWNKSLNLVTGKAKQFNSNGDAYVKDPCVKK